MAENRIIKFKTKADHKRDSVKAILERTLAEADDIEEIMVLMKPKSDGKQDYNWDHSDIVGTFWWTGLLSYVIFKFNTEQQEGQDGGW